MNDNRHGPLQLSDDVCCDGVRGDIITDNNINETWNETRAAQLDAREILPVRTGSSDADIPQNSGKTSKTERVRAEAPSDARVDRTSSARSAGRNAGRNDAKPETLVKSELAPRETIKSASLKNKEQRCDELTCDWDVYQSRLLRAFFRDANALASRYRVSSEDIVSHVRSLSQPKIDLGLMLKPVPCVGDVTVAAACCLGRANAWNELWVFAEPAMTRAAFSRLPEALALTWTRRFWMQLERTTRQPLRAQNTKASRADAVHTSAPALAITLAAYDGSRPIRLWIVEQLLGAIEAERLAGHLEIRREQLGRPFPVRLVGHCLA